MLSNTATPIYYGRWREKVLNGEIPVNKEIAMQMRLIDDLIENPGIYYDDEAINGFIAFCEDELTLTDGSDVHLLETFKLWAEDLLSWFYFEDRQVYVPGKYGDKGRFVTRRIKRRLRNKQVLIIGRGSAKTLYDEFIQAYGLVVDTSTTHQITTAPTMKQAEEVLAPFRTAITRSRGPLFQFLTEGSLQNTTGNRAYRKKLCSTKNGIENFLTGSLLEPRPMKIDKLQGLRVKYTTIDEWLSREIREDPTSAIEQGASKIDDWVLVATSSEGTVRNGIGDTMKLEYLKVLKGEYYNPHLSVWYYRLDDIREVGDPSMWMKAMPNIGITVSYDAVQMDVQRAEVNPSARNDILAKRFGIPMEGLTYFFTYPEIQPHPRRSFWGMPCSMGADMSRGDDFCAFDFLFPINERDFGLKARSYITESSYMKLPQATRQKYDEFIEEGTLVIMPGTILDMDQVYDDVDKFIRDNEYDVRCFGYDPYNAEFFVKRWCSEHTDYGVVKVIQGARTESVPLGELKKLAEDRGLIFDEEIVKFTMGNSIVSVDTNGNYKLMKDRREQKIDNVAAAMDALVAYKQNKLSF